MSSVRRTRSKQRASVLEAARAAVDASLSAPGGGTQVKQQAPTPTPAKKTKAKNRVAKADAKAEAKMTTATVGGDAMAAGGATNAAIPNAAGNNASHSAGGKRKKYTSLKTYIHKIWKQHQSANKGHERTSNQGAMNLLQDACYSLVDRLCHEVQELKQKPYRERMPGKRNRQQTNAHDVQMAFQMLFSRCDDTFRGRFLRRMKATLDLHKAAREQKAATAAAVAALVPAPALSAPAITV